MILRGGGPTEEAEGEELVKTLRNHVATEIGPIAKPRQVMIVTELPEDPLRQDHAAAVA